MASEASIPHPKRPRVQGVASDQSPNQVELDESFDEEPRPRAKRNRTSEETSGPSKQRLIEVIKGNGKYIPQVVKLWVEQYEADSRAAMIELLMMLFEACGAKYHIQGNFLDETDVDDVVVALVKLAKEGEIEDYQGSKKKEFKNFKENLLSFWDNLVIECQNGPLFDQVLFEKCMDYIIALSCTPPRVYRQIASLMGLQLVTSFITVSKTLGTQRETTQRQLNAEEKKKKPEESRVQSLKKRVETTHAQITFIDDIIQKKMFHGLFVHRYRDVDPNIRMSCIQSLGVWVLSYPSIFLQDQYLKYLGWTLNDKSPGVRKASVLALQNLYEVDDHVLSLGLFTERFSTRMMDLADDIDVSVAVSAIGLVKQLLRHGFLQDNDLGPLYDLLIDDPPEIRRAIGALVYDHLIAQKFSSSQFHPKGDNNHSSEVHLGRMLQILREFSADPILSAYVIDDIWEYMDAMKDWKCIKSMLLDENPFIELTDADATNLIRLLSASVKKAVGDRIVPTAENRKQNYTKAQKEIFENNRRSITVGLMKNYPHLLRKFMADKAKIPSLIEIVMHMNLELYSLKRQEQNFKSVLELIKEAFFKHGEKDALESCVKAIIFCSSESRGELQDFAHNKLKEIEDEIIAKLIAAIKDVMDGDDEYSLLVNLKRLYELQLSRPVPIEILYDQIIMVLQSFRNLDEEAICFLLLNMHMHVLWCLHSITTSESVSRASLASLVSKRNCLFEQLEFFLQSPAELNEGVKCGNLLACRVCTILSEEWHVFRKENFASTKLESLGYCPDASKLQSFWNLCERQLNVSDETEDEDANREYIEDSNRVVVMIAAARLIAINTVPKDYLGPEVISHFVMHGSSVAEVVKYLISVLKKKDDNVPHIFLESLRRAYYRYAMKHSEGNDESFKHFQVCKDLAARLAGTFVRAARSKHRSYILQIVKDGIEYAFAEAPKQLSFLECAVLPFVSKLPTADVLDIIKDVQTRTKNVNTDEDPSGWQPYFMFVDSLCEKYTKNDGIQDEKEGFTKRRRGRPRKQNNLQGRKLFNEQSSSEEDSISTSDNDAGDDEERQDMEDEDAPLIHSFPASTRLRSLRISRDGNEGQTGITQSAGTADNLATSKAGGSSG